jgi:hypothetical protein
MSVLIKDKQIIRSMHQASRHLSLDASQALSHQDQSHRGQDCFHFARRDARLHLNPWPTAVAPKTPSSLGTHLRSMPTIARPSSTFHRHHPQRRSQDSSRLFRPARQVAEAPVLARRSIWHHRAVPDVGVVATALHRVGEHPSPRCPTQARHIFTLSSDQTQLSHRRWLHLARAWWPRPSQGKSSLPGLVCGH